MIKGFYSAATSMYLNTERQKILSHNISNLDTPGFKQVLTNLEEFKQTEVVFPMSRLPGVTSHENLGSIGLGLGAVIEHTDFTEGTLKYTANELDFSIAGNGFFRIRTPQGERFTRDGRFIRDANNQLTTVEGYQVLNSDGQPITLPEGTVAIEQNGNISVNRQPVTKLGVAVFKDPETELLPGDGNKFSSTTAPTNTGGGTVEQGYLEMSNVNAASVTTQMVMMARSYEAAQKMVQTQDDLLGRAISTLGRF